MHSAFYRILFSFLILVSKISYAQPSGNCDPATPFFNVNLSGNPNGTWTSTPTPRIDNCCGTTSPDKCVEFKITLSPQAVAINFQIVSGAIPSGAMYYQINCGPPVPVGSPLCLNGPGPYTLTFCKPGNNINTYAITSMAAPSVSPNDTIGNGCSTTMYASGLLVNSTITWNSIYPGAVGAYNSLLSCTNSCTATTVTGNPTAPPYIDYVVCGQPVAGNCVPYSLFCDTIRIFFSPPITNSITPNPAVFCSNNPSGVTLTGTIGGGLPPYTYAWTNGANGTGTVVGTALTYNATVGGNYSLIVYDKNYPSCPPQITNVNVSVSPSPTITAGPDQTLCANTVQLNGSVTGATGGIWTGGNGTFSPNNTAPNAIYTPSAAELLNGTIVLTYNSTGNGACLAVSDQVVIHIAPPLVVNLTAPSTVCFGQTTNVTSIVTGGFTPYNYSWNTGQTTSSIFGVSAGTYSLTVTGSGVGCSTTAAITIQPNPQIIVNMSPNNSVACGTFAVVSATAIGGTGSLTYQWSNGSNSSSTNVYSGTHIVTVTDAVGCTASNSVTVLTSNSALVASINQPSVICYGTTVNLMVLANGGFGGYNYSWNNGATTNNINVGPGSYCATVTDGGGCIASACVNVIQNSPIVINIPQPPVICNGAATTVNSFVSGGLGPYSYAWSNGQSAPAMNATAGNYALTVTDSRNCTNTATLSILQSPPLGAIINYTPVSCFAGNDGKAIATVVGGTTPYYYSWSPYGGAGALATGLLAGNFNVTVTDAAGCSISQSVTITQPTAITASVVISNPISCNGGNNGSLFATANGGNSNYTYQWLPNGNTSQNPTNLSAGQYIVTVTDMKGCTQTAQATLVEPPLLTSSLLGVSGALCNGGSTGSATLTGIGGTPNYSYQWMPNGSTGSIVHNLAAGMHTVTITDANFCSAIQIVTINQPPILNASLNLINNVSCNGGSNGSAIVNPTGGTAPYAYFWNSVPTQTTQVATGLPAGNFMATVTDANNCVVTTTAITLTQPAVLTVTASPSALVSCSAAIVITNTISGGSSPYSYLWSTGSTAPSISVYTGNYQVTVTDNLGCTATATAAVLSASNSLAATINQPGNICNGSSVTISVTATGGFGSYIYQWDNAATTNTVNVLAGQHCVNVTDGGGCITSACVNVVQNQPLQALAIGPQYVCPIASANVTANVSGGQAPFNYLWSNGLTTPTVNLAIGNYTLTVTDASGPNCKTTATVSVKAEPFLSLVPGGTDVSCYGGNNGTASVYVTGGVPNYTYTWQGSTSNNSIIGGLTVGVYSVIVTDAIGCSKVANVTINQPPTQVVAIPSATNVSCFGKADGAVSSSVNGGTTPYYYYWTPQGSSSVTVGGLVAGSYSLFVADSTGCLATTEISLTSPSAITNTNVITPSTCGYSNGSATVNLSGSGGVYTYTWNPTNTHNNSISNVLGGNYTLSVLDNLNCPAQINVNIPSFVSTASAGFNASTECLNSPTLFTDLSVKGNDSIVSWSWDFGDPLSGSSNFSLLQNPNHIYTSTGSYSPVLTVLTALGCTKTFSLTVPFYPTPNPDFLLNPVCANSSISFTNTSNISSGSITNYNWNFGDPMSASSNTSTVLNPVHYYTNIGVYTITLTTISNNNCVASKTHTLQVFPLPNVNFVASTVCVNQSAQFVNQSTGSIASWAWNFDDGSPIDVVNLNPQHTYTNSGSYSVVLSVMSNNNCSNSDTLIVNVNVAPIVNFNSAAACLNSPTVFTDLSFIPTGTITAWSWNFGDFTANNSSQNPTHIFATAGVYNVNLTATSAQGCSASIIHTVAVYPSPIAQFSVSSPCSGSTSFFTDLSTISNGGTIQSWMWAFGDGSPVDVTQNPNHTYPINSVYNPSLVVTSSNGCKDTATSSLYIFPNPVIQFAANATSGCSVFCPTFTDVTTPSGLITGWQWSFGDGTSDTSPNPTHCFSTPGSYSISLTALTTNNCAVASTQTMIVNVYDNPVANFSFTPADATSSSPQIQFTDMSSNDAVKWTWNFGDDSELTNSTIADPLHSYDQAGDYCIYMKAFNEHGCYSDIRKCLDIDMDFTFYVPNAFTPGISNGVNDVFYGVGTNISKFEMYIFDRWGERIYYSDDIYKGWDGKVKNSGVLAKQDVYTYKIYVTDFKDELHIYVGHVNVIR